MEKDDVKKVLDILLEKKRKTSDMNSYIFYDSILSDIPIFKDLVLFINMTRKNDDKVDISLNRYRCVDDNYSMRIIYNENTTLNIEFDKEYMNIYLEYEDYSDNYKCEEYFVLSYNRNGYGYKNNMNKMFENNGVFSKIYMTEILNSI